MFEFRGLRYFVEVAEKKSFSKAADVLHVAQPALSRQIKKLEDEFGTPLFLRHARGVELTEAGALLKSRARSLFKEVSDTTEQVIAFAKRPSGPVRLGVSAAPAAMLVPQLAKKIKSLFPEISLRVAEGYGCVVEQWLADGEIDIAIMPDPGGEGAYNILHLIEDDLIAIGPVSDHVAAYSLKEIAALPLIMPDSRHRYRQVIDRNMRKHGLSPNLQFEIEGTEIMLSMVRQGLGYAIVAHPLVFDDKRLRVIQILPKHSVTMRWVAATSASRDRTRAISEVLNLAGRVASEIVEQRLWPGNPRTFEEIVLPPVAHAH